jgi:hypothetical protein
MHLRQNPQRFAWIVLFASFFTCCLSAVAVPLGVRGYLLHSDRPRVAYVTALAGTVQVQPPGAADPVAVTERRAVEEGSRVMTDATSRALLTVFAGDPDTEAVATLQLSQDSAVSIPRVRSPRFSWSGDPHQISAMLERGRVFFATQNAKDRDVEARLETPQAEVRFEIGTIDAIVSADESQVRVRSGPAVIAAAGRQVTANSGERVTVATGGPPNLPVPAAQDLVLNGSFEDRLTPPWDQIVEVAGGLPPGKVTVESVGQRQAVRFSRRAEDGAPNRVGITQNIDRDVQGYDSLVFRLDLQLLNQSVPGGGYLATEYPVMVDIAYTDVYGKDLHWYQGFYYLDLPSGSNYLPPSGEKIPLGIWYTYESPNLFDALRETRPARINSITIYASGHDYESLVSDAALIVR